MRTNTIVVGLLFAGIVLTLPLDATAQGESESSWIGIKLDGIVPVDQGVPISRIFEDSPAAKAGLRGGDAITAIDGEPVSSIPDLIRRVREHDPGSWVSLTAIRKGREIDLRVRLGTRPTSLGDLKVRNGWIGVKTIELPPSLREHFGAPPEAGVMIAEVVEGSPAEAAGFELGDVVYEVNGLEVHSSGQLRELVGGGGVGNEIEFAVARSGLLLVLETRLIVAPE